MEVLVVKKPKVWDMRVNGQKRSAYFVCARYKNNNTPYIEAIDAKTGDKICVLTASCKDEPAVYETISCDSVRMQIDATYFRTRCLDSMADANSLIMGLLDNFLFTPEMDFGNNIVVKTLRGERFIKVSPTDRLYEYTKAIYFSKDPRHIAEDEARNDTYTYNALQKLYGEDGFVMKHIPDSK